MNTMKEKKFVKVIYKECPMCRQETYLRLTKEQMEQCTKYTCCGGLIQDVLPSLDKFGREFVKMGYCPSCQEIKVHIFHEANQMMTEYMNFLRQQRI